MKSEIAVGINLPPEVFASGVGFCGIEDQRKVGGQLVVRDDFEELVPLGRVELVRLGRHEDVRQTCFAHIVKHIVVVLGRTGTAVDELADELHGVDIFPVFLVLNLLYLH